MLDTRSFNKVTITNVLILLAIFFTLLESIGTISNVYYGINPFLLELKMYSEVVRSFFTSNFLHSGTIHLLGNAFVLYLFGNGLEQNIGRFKYLSLFFITSILNGIFLYYFTDIGTITVGISGFCMAVIAYYGYELFVRNDPRYMMFLQYTIFGALVGLLPFVSLYGHIGGTICGVLVFVLFNFKKI